MGKWLIKTEPDEWSWDDQVKSADEYAEIMNNLKLSNPKMMDIAVPANIKGLTLNQI